MVAGWAREKFEPVANDEQLAQGKGPRSVLLQRPHPNGYGYEAFPFSCLAQITYAVPMADVSTLQIVWPLLPVQLQYRSGAAGLVSNLLGTEAKGSLLAVLKAKGWGLALSAGLDAEVSDFSTMTVTVTLSEEGLAHTDEIAELTYKYVRLIKEQGMIKPRWDQSVKLSEISFSQWSKPAAASFAKTLATKMHRVPPGPDLLSPPSRRVWNDGIAMEIVNSLRPRNSLVFVYSKRNDTFPPLETIEPWFGTLYTNRSIPEELLQRWEAALGLTHEDDNDKDGLSLPPPNPFIPDSLEIVAAYTGGAVCEGNCPAPAPVSAPAGEKVIGSSTDNRTLPLLLVNNSNLELWWKQGANTFKSAKVDLKCTIKAPRAYDSALHDAFVQLWIQWLSEALNAQLYPASEAGFTYTVAVAATLDIGLTLAVNGYSNKVGTFVDFVMDAVDMLSGGGSGSASGNDPAVFARAREAVLLRYKSLLKEAPYRDLLFLHSKLTTTPRYQYQKIIDELEGITNSQHVVAYARDELLAGKLQLRCLVHGNILPPVAIKLAKSIAGKLRHGRRLQGTGDSRERKQLQEGTHVDSNSGVGGEAHAAEGGALASADDRGKRAEGEISRRLVDDTERAGRALVGVAGLGTQVLETRIQPGVETIVRTTPLNGDDDNSAVMHSYQVCVDSDSCDLGVRCAVMMDLLSLVLSQPAFAQLRTVEQLGYIVFTFARRGPHARYLNVIVQGSTKDAGFMSERVDSFMKTYFLQWANSTSAKELNQLKEVQVATILEKPLQMESATGIMWPQVSEGRYQFAWAQDKVDALRTITMDELVEFYRRAVLNSSTRRMLNIQLFGKLHALPEPGSRGTGASAAGAILVDIPKGSMLSDEQVDAFHTRNGWIDSLAKCVGVGDK
jgi:secreted Zn-dependent insulinase-like peptidase